MPTPTTARSWLASAGLLLLSACDSNPPPHTGPWTGEQLFVRELCSSCHGLKREGSWMGPPLTAIDQHWDRQGLIDYIRKPAEVVASNTRLAALSRQFRVPMADHLLIGLKDRETLADWLLEGPPAP